MVSSLSDKGARQTMGHGPSRLDPARLCQAGHLRNGEACLLGHRWRRHVALPVLLVEPPIGQQDQAPDERDLEQQEDGWQETPRCDFPETDPDEADGGQLQDRLEHEKARGEGPRPYVLEPVLGSATRTSALPATSVYAPVSGAPSWSLPSVNCLCEPCAAPLLLLVR